MNISPKQERFFWVLPAVLFVSTGLYMIFMQPLQTAVAFSAMDDGLYYPRLAQNIIEKGWCTYDGMTATNGFHPLWLLLQLPVYFLFHNPWVALWAVYGLIFLVQLCALGLFWRIAQRLQMTVSGWTAALFILLINIRSMTIFFSFLESPLVLLALLGFLTFCLAEGESRFTNPKTAFFVGVLIGVCFLSRLDTFWLAVAYAGVWTIGFFRDSKMRICRMLSAIAATVGCLLPVFPYLLWNWVGFGHLQTVSAWQKTASISPVASCRIVFSWTLHQFIPRVQHILGLETMAPGVLLSVFIVTGVAGVIFLVTGGRRSRLLQAISCCPEFVLFTLFHLVFIFLVAPQEAAASAWYWVPEITLAAIVVGVALPEWRMLKLPIVPAVVVLLVGLQFWAYPALVARKTMSFAKLEVAEYLRENTNVDIRGAMFDSGIVSYFSQRSFVGINGLIGDFKHAQMIRDKRYGEAFSRCGVNLLVLDTPERVLDAFAPHILYCSTIRTRFENFNEPPKPFVVYIGTPAQLENIWNVRYNYLR